ncbi:MAG: hypothetical protein WC803_12045 [Sphingomonas sp.]
MENDIAASTVSGPQVEPPRLDPVARQAEIAQVLAAATEAMPRSVMRKLGRLSVAEALEDDDQAYFLQIRSEPIGTSGVEFRFPLPAFRSDEPDVDRKVGELVEAATAIVRATKPLKAFSQIIRENAQRVIGSATDGISPLQIVAIGARPTPTGIETTIDLRTLGADLRVGVHRVSETDTDRLDRKLRQLVETHLRCQTELARVTVAGGTGWIDDAALGVIGMAGLDPTAVLRMLKIQRDVEFRFGDGATGAVYWEDGTIRGHIVSRGPASHYRLDGDLLTVNAKGLPATILAALVGRRLRNVVDIECIPHSALITGTEQRGDMLKLTMELGRRTIEQAVLAGL